MATREELHALRKDLIPLEAAAALAYERLYGHAQGAGSDAVRARDALAHALAERTTIYTHDVERTEITALQRHEVAGGEFRDGAQRLCFRDGRAEITRLAIRSSDLRRTIEVMRTTGTSYSAGAENAASRSPGSDRSQPA